MTVAWREVPGLVEALSALGIAVWGEGGAFHSTDDARAQPIIDAYGAPPLPVPPKVTNFQARAVMRRVLLPDGRSLFMAVRVDLKAGADAAQALPADDPQRIAAEDAWEAFEQANDFYRNGPLVNAMGQIYGLAGASLDQLFRDAATIEA